MCRKLYCSFCFFVSQTSGYSASHVGIIRVPVPGAALLAASVNGGRFSFVRERPSHTFHAHVVPAVFWLLYMQAIQPARAVIDVVRGQKLAACMNASKPTLAVRENVCVQRATRMIDGMPLSVTRSSVQLECITDRIELTIRHPGSVRITTLALFEACTKNSYTCI
jgi:hypothetical protein